MLFLIIGITFVLLISSVMAGLPAYYALFISLVMLSLHTIKLGNSPKAVGKMILLGVGKAMNVLKIFIFIGFLTAMWLSSGTIPYLVYLGVQVINPNLFILSAFILTAMIAFVLGTSFGTASTIGLVLITIAKSSGVDVFITAGAIICGLYFGDRGSPMSSSLNLLSSITDTNLYSNVKMTFRTALIPTLFTCVLYLFLSFKNPMQTVSTSLPKDIEVAFVITPILLIPAIIILAMCLFKVDVRIAMFTSTIAGIAISYFIQGNSPITILKTLILGLQLPSEFAVSTLIKGGGLMSIMSAIIVVLVSCSIAGIFENANLLGTTMDKFNPTTRVGIFFTDVIVATISSAVGCNQTISVIMTTSIMSKIYEKNNIPNTELAKDISLTSTIIAPIIPWNISVLTPITMFGLSGIAYMPYIFLLYAMPLWYFVIYYYKDKKARTSCE